jgi:hypothetical protein
MSYFNTTNETREYRNQADRQEDLVLEYYRLMRRASPSQVHEDILRTAPLTSVRRCITNLANDGKLVKTEMKVKGQYGRLEYVWELVGDTSQRELF